LRRAARVDLHSTVIVVVASELTAERQNAFEKERLLLVSRGNVQKDCRRRGAVATVAR
jgi:hypothetical protein